jgi:hypothetical protein
MLMAAVAAIGGLAAGLLINAASPNPTYGIQIIADVVVLAVVLVVAVVAPLRRLLPAAIGLAFGVIAGVAIGMSTTTFPSLLTAGTVEIVLEQPEVTTLSAPASCYVQDGVFIDASTSEGADLRLGDGRTIAVRVGPAEQEPILPEQPMGVDIRVSSTLPDGSQSETQMVSDATSEVTLVDNGTTGSMTFASLVLHELSELRVPVPFEGTVTWSCPPSL